MLKKKHEGRAGNAVLKGHYIGKQHANYISRQKVSGIQQRHGNGIHLYILKICFFCIENFFSSIITVSKQ